MKVKTNMVTRRVIESRTYNIFSLDNETMTKLDTIDIKGRVNEKELAKKYNVDKVAVIEIAVTKKVYGVPIDEYMKLAKEISCTTEPTN